MKLVVNFVLRYLRFFAKLQLAKFRPDVIGITGSVGKTATTVAIGVILEQKYKVKTCAGANSETGIPLDILGIRLGDRSAMDWLRVMLLAPIMLLVNWRGYEKYVVEMGVDEPTAPKNMAYLLTIVRPRVGVMLNVAPVHTQQFGSVEAIAREKGKLIQQLPANGIAILNRNDPLVWQWHNQTQAKVVEFQPNSDFAAAIATGGALGIPAKQAREALEQNYTAPPGRMSLIPGVKNTLIIDSSYNASRASMFKALDVLDSYKNRRKIAVLGDMRELGDLAKTEHEAVAQRAKKIADVIVTVGPFMKQYLGSKYSFDSSKEAGKFVKEKLLKDGDVVLVKGSQNTIFLELVVEALMANPEDADKVLCRRGGFWDKMRAQIP